MAENTIFSKLKRLFSTDVIIRNVGGKQLKVIDVDKIQSHGDIKTNTLVDRFTRLHRGTGGTNSAYNPTLNHQNLRIQLYADYEAMDTDSIIASALDIISDECTLKNETGEMLHIRSSDENVQKILYNLFYDILNIEFNLWVWIRNMCKYGDFYVHLEIADKFGIINAKPLSVYDVVREEGMDIDNPSYVCFKIDPTALGTGLNRNPSQIKFENYEIAHFRLLADVNYLPYGRSYIEPARKNYKQLILMEDAMLVHRIMRAPDKRIFYVNVGSIPPAEVDNFMRKTIDRMKKTPYVDPQTGDYNLKFNMQNMLEDFYIPVRGNDQSTKIDTAPGLQYNGIEDVNYLRDKMLAALKIPKAFFGYEKDLTGKATLAAEDIRFARTIERIQRIILSELTKIALVHLYVQGYEGEELTNFELSLTTPSIIYDQERIALMKEKVDLAGQLIDKKLLPTDWIYDNIFHFSEDQYDEYRDLILQDQKRAFRYTQVETEGNDPAESGESYGTPHDLATLYGKGRYGEGIPDGYDENEVGRPKEKASIYNTQDSGLGKDALGKQDLKPYKPDTTNLGGNNKGGSPLSINYEAKMAYHKNKDVLSSLRKKSLIYEQEKHSEKLLDEDNIREA